MAINIFHAKGKSGNDSPAVAASVLAASFFFAVTDAMTNRVAVAALDLDSVETLDSLLLAGTSSMAKFLFWSVMNRGQTVNTGPLQETKLGLTSAVSTLDNAAIVRESSISQALEIFFRGCGPAIP